MKSTRRNRRPAELPRRHVLRAAGVSLALPWLESAAAPAAAKKGSGDAAAPKRLCCVMFPYGVAVPDDDKPERPWGWFPLGEGKDTQLTKVLEPLDPLMDDVTIFSGLSHPNCRKMNGHDTGDTFLTGNNLEPVTYRNTISLDQFAAERIGHHTRLRSLTLSTDGGVGPRTRSTTLSYSAKGQPIPALADPKQIFQRMFGDDGASQADRRRLDSSASILDVVMEQSGSLRRQLGVADRRKLDEYETSVRDVEQRVERAHRWLQIPLPEVDPGSVALEANPEQPVDYLTAIYDLMFLAFQTDLTRLATYQIGSYGPTLARTFPAAIGLEPNWHSLAHGARKPGGAEKIGRFDRFLAEHLARFLRRLKETPEGEDGASLLDRTLVLYGSSNSRTHVNSNYPMLLAGGGQLGVTHRRSLRFDADVPLSNLFVRVLHALDIEADRFADSTGPLADV